MDSLFIEKKAENYYIITIISLRSFCHFHSFFLSLSSALTTIARFPKLGGNFGADMRERGTEYDRGDRISVLVEALFPLSLPALPDTRRDSPRQQWRTLAFPGHVCERFLFFLSWLRRTRSDFMYAPNIALLARERKREKEGSRYRKAWRRMTK